MSRTTTKVLAALATVPLLAALAACATPAAGENAGDDVVKIGVVGKSDPQWAAFEEAAADEGITIELVDFADYAQPNPATTEGELDLNQFQHIVYLADYNVSAGEDLTPIGATAIYPLGLYSTKYDSVEDIPEGETVAVPNDASNQARAPARAAVGRPHRAEERRHDLLRPRRHRRGEVHGEGHRPRGLAHRRRRSRMSRPPSSTTTSCEDAGLSFEDAIAQDDPSDPNALPYVNIFAARAEDADNETYLKLVEIFQTDPEVQAACSRHPAAPPCRSPRRSPTSSSRSRRSRPTPRPPRAERPRPIHRTDHRDASTRRPG